MQFDGPTDSKALAVCGVEALHLLCSGNITTLADRFGYAFAYEREPAAAIQEDLDRLLVALGATSLGWSDDNPAPIVRYFRPNDTGLLAEIDCFVQTNNGAQLNITLILAGRGADRWVYLEDLLIAPGMRVGSC